MTLHVEFSRFRLRMPVYGLFVDPSLGGIYVVSDGLLPRKFILTNAL